MAENLKSLLRAMRAQERADAEAARVQATRDAAQRQADRLRQQPELAEDEPEPAKWVRANLEWAEHPGLWCFKDTGYSDYSGDFVHKSNGAYLLATYPTLFESGFGGYGSVWVGIAEDKRLALTQADLASLELVLADLENYPVLDEEGLSRLETDAQWEHWQEYGRDGVREALVRKFAGQADAQIAVVLKGDAFWDEWYSENSGDEYMVAEAGCQFYFSADGAVRAVGIGDVYDREEVQAFKRKFFFAEGEAGADKFARLLAQAGLEVKSEQQLWLLFERAEQKVNPWEVKKHFHRGSAAAEYDNEDAVTLDEAALADMVGVLTKESPDQVMRQTWGEDPKQRTLPVFESQAQRLVTWLLEGFNEKAQAFIRQGAEAGAVKRVLADFKQLRDQRQLAGAPGDIDAYASFDEVARVVQAAQQAGAAKRAEAKDYTLVWETPRYRVLSPHNQKVAMTYGKGTKWCISGVRDNRFFNYRDRGKTHFFVLPKAGGEKFAVTLGGAAVRIHNAADRQVTPEVFLAATGMDLAALLRLPQVEGAVRETKQRQAAAKAKAKTQAEAERAAAERSFDQTAVWAAREYGPRIRQLLALDDAAFVAAMEPLRKAIEPWLGVGGDGAAATWPDCALGVRDVLYDILEGEPEGGHALYGLSGLEAILQGGPVAECQPVPASKLANALLEGVTLKGVFKAWQAASNTRFIYGYRDAANHKQLEELVLEGWVGPIEVWQKVATADGQPGDFLPGQIGLEPLQARCTGFPSEDDGVTHEIWEVEATQDAPTADMSAADLYAQFKRADRDGWDLQAEWERVGLP